jgi:hypothetical protein
VALARLRRQAKKQGRPFGPPLHAKPTQKEEEEDLRRRDVGVAIAMQQILDVYLNSYNRPQSKNTFAFFEQVING